MLRSFSLSLTWIALGRDYYLLWKTMFGKCFSSDFSVQVGLTGTIFEIRIYPMLE